MKVQILSVLVLALICSAADAVVNALDPTGNTSAPTGTGGQPGDPGWANMGVVNSSSGVYLGWGWVLTAKHVGAGNFTSVSGIVYNWDKVNSYSLSGTDLTLFKLSETPDLSAMALAQASPANGSAVVMIGNGVTVASAAKTYYVDKGTDPWTWRTATFPEADATYEGFAKTSGRAMRWGTNTVSGRGYDSKNIGYYLYTSFTKGGTTYEAQGVTNDSGGGVFYYDLEEAEWVLAGIMVSVSNYSGQPNGTGSAFYGNGTYCVDLAYYADEIYTIIPEPVVTGVLLAAVTALAASLIRRHGRR